MENDAPWRRAAAERIEKIRKGDLTVVVADRIGRPLADAEVRLRQTRQAFGLGTGVSLAALTGPDGPRYQQLLTELFNVATLDDNLMWAPLAGDWGPTFTIQAAKDGIARLRAHGLDVRARVLVWPGWRHLPRALRAHEHNAGYLRTATMARIREVMTDVKGTVIQWDVLNAPFDDHELVDILGEGVMVDWFNAARAVDPGAKLFIDDGAILSGGGDARQASYEKTIRFLEEKNAPLDGIGMQGHFGASLTSPDDLLAILDRFAALGKTIWVTAYDVDVPDEGLAGRFTRDFYTTMFSHPAVGGVVMSRFWDGGRSKGNAALYRRDGSLTPAGEAFRELALASWRTDAAGRTDTAGKLSRRAFLGDFDVEVSFGGKTKVQKVRLAAPGAAITVAMP
jgi:GH35 family endo-1,4-beta-xylanase